MELAKSNKEKGLVEIQQSDSDGWKSAVETFGKCLETNNVSKFNDHIFYSFISRFSFNFIYFLLCVSYQFIIKNNNFIIST